MTRSRVSSPPLPPRSIRNVFATAVIFAAFGVVGCGNTCVSGFTTNGFFLNTASPASACSLTQAKGAVRVVALKSPVCETCTAAARLEHLFVTLRSIQLRPSALDNTDAPDWLEIAPQLANEPRQIDLIGDSMPEILVENAIVPAGIYREVRLEFSPDSPANAEKLSAENACGETRWNCTIMADGHVEPLRLPGDAPELLIAIQSLESDSFVVLPESRMELQLSLEPHQVAYSSSTEGWKLQSVLVGRASVVRQWSVEQEESISN